MKNNYITCIKPCVGRVVLPITFNYLMWKIIHTVQRSLMGKCTGSISIPVTGKETGPHWVWEGKRDPQTCRAVDYPTHQPRGTASAPTTVIVIAEVTATSRLCTLHARTQVILTEPLRACIVFVPMRQEGSRGSGNVPTQLWKRGPSLISFTFCLLKWIQAAGCHDRSCAIPAPSLRRGHPVRSERAERL